MPLNIIRNDISKVKADAIVNTANPEVTYGYGVDSTIYKAAGAEELLAQREKIGRMSPGQAAETPAFALDAKYIIHTVGPVWEGGRHGEDVAVASCYRNSLNLADKLKCESIAFPLISTGTYGFPKDKALDIAMREIGAFLEDHDMDVTLVVYDKESFVVSGKAFEDIKSFIEEKDVMAPMAGGSSYGARRRRDILRRRRRQRREEYREEYVEEESNVYPGAPSGPVVNMDLDSEEHVISEKKAEYIEYEAPAMFSINESEFDIPFDPETGVHSKELTFQQMLFRIIDRKGMKDPEVYRRANIDRRLFSRIRSNENYQPSKKTALALCVALRLNLDETMDLILRAGYALSPSDDFDIIVGYCITHGIYNIHKINSILFEFTEQVLYA